MNQSAPSSMADQSPRSVWPSIARAAFVLATLAAAGWLLAREWDDIGPALAEADMGLIAFALVAAIINVAMTGLSWRALLSRAPVQLSLGASARIFFLGQIGKYLPGTVWSFLASGELAKRAGFSRGAAMSSLLLALIIGVGSGVLVALMLVPQAIGWLPDNALVWVAGLAICGIALLPPVRARLLKFARIDFPVPLASIALSGALAVAAWLFAGAQIVLLSQAIGGSLGWEDLLYATGSYAFAWIAGFVVVIAPAGLGAREGGLLATLGFVVGLAEATAIILLSRLVVTCADFACAGLAALASSPSAAPEAAPPLHRG